MSARYVIAAAMSDRREQLTGEASPLDYDGARLVLSSLERSGFAVIQTDDGAVVPGQGLGGSSPAAVAPSSPIVPGPELIGGQPGPASFQMIRHHDVTGVSGTGLIGEGTRFRDGTTVFRWYGDHPSTSVWPSVQEVVAVHGHQGATELRWLGRPSDGFCRVCGCTEESACFGGCYWVAPDLCSQCGDGPVV